MNLPKVHGFRAMDNLRAPQWVDFNASDHSDVDDFFNVEHKELESGYRWITSPASDSPISSGADSQHTPRSNGYASPGVVGSGGGRTRFNRTSESLARAMSALHIKSAKKALLRESMTPGAKCPSANSTLMANVVEDEDDDDNVRMKEEEEEPKTNDAVCTDISIQGQPQANSPAGAAVEEAKTDDKPTLIASEKEEKEDDVPREPVAKIQSADIEKNPEPESVKTDERKVLEDRSELEEKSSNARSKPEKSSSNINSMSENKPSDSHSKPEEKSNAVRSKFEKKPSNIRTITSEKSSSARPDAEINFEPSKPSCPEKKNARARPENARVLVNNVRRHSISKYRRRASGQYVGLAEAVARFQNGTPQRFRSARHRDNQPGPVQKTKQTKMKLTTPMSPALICKTRSRAASTNASAQPQPQVAKTFAQSLRTTQSTSAAGAARAPKKIEKIPTIVAATTANPMLPPAVPEPTRMIDKSLSVPSLTNDPSAALSSMLSTSMMSTSIIPESTRKHTPCRKTVATVVSCDDGKAIKEVEVLHFGIPVGKVYKKITRPIPFSFETRGKGQQAKRSQQTQEKPAKTATARPAPIANPVKKTTSTSALKPRDNNASKVPLCTLTFQQRNELALKKKRELMDQIVQREKQARVFHAKPAPHFKPVSVRGVSPGPAPRGQGTVALENQENKAPNKAK